MLTGLGKQAIVEAFTPQYLQAMSEEQLTALFAKLKDNAEIQEKLKGAADPDTAVAMAKEAGFDVSKADWLRYQAKQTLELSDEELDGVAGGKPVAETYWDNTRTEVEKELRKIMEEKKRALPKDLP